MNMNQYLQHLQAGLQDYPENFRNETLHFYRSYFLKCRKEGKSDDEIIAETGTPDEILKHISMTSYFAKDTASERGSILEKSTAEAAASVRSLFRTVSSAAEDALHSSEKALLSLFKNSGKKLTVFREGEFDEITIFCMNGAGIDITSGKDAVISFLSADHGSHNHLLFAENGREFRIRAEEEGIVFLQLPHNMKRISIRTECGSICIHSAEAESLAVDAGSSSVDIDSVRTDNLAVDLSSGSIRISNLFCREASVRQEEGSLAVRYSLCSLIDVKCSSGNISLSMKTDRAKIYTASGSIDAEIEGRFAAAVLETFSGSISFASDISMTCIHCSTDGSVINHSGLPAMRMDTQEYRIGSGPSRVLLSSQEGDIEVTEL